MKSILLFLILGALAFGCDDGPPKVVSTGPDDQATEVERTVTIEATFSHDMAADTLDATTFTVAVDGTSLGGTVSYDEATRTATFHPDGELDPLTSYTATVAADAIDAAGVALDDETSWTFTTRERRWGTAELVLTSNVETGAVGGARIAVDPAGPVIATWHVPDGPWRDVWTKRFVPGEGWGSPTLLVDTGDGDVGQVFVAVDASSNAFAVWNLSDGSTNSVWANRFEPGSGWGTATSVETEAGEAYAASLGVDADGNAIVLWVDESASPSIWASRFVRGVGWGTATLIGTAHGSVSLAVDRDGNATAVWFFDPTGTNREIWANRFEPGSGWGTAAPVYTGDTGDVRDLQLAVDAAGNAIAVLSKFDGTPCTEWCGSVWATRFVPDVGWSEAELIGTVDVDTVLTTQLAVDAAGNAIVVWDGYKTMGSTSLGTHIVGNNRYEPERGWGASTPLGVVDPFALRVADSIAVWGELSDGNFRASRFVDGAWDPTVIVSGGDGDLDYGDLQLAADASGDVTAIWEQNDSTGQNYVWANSFR